MQYIDKKIGIEDLEKMAKGMFGNFVKAVVDIEKGVMVVDAELHADEERFLLEKGSKQENVWGINLYPELFGEEDFIEFDSMINVRPAQNNRGRDVESLETQEKILDVVHNLMA